ncbi:MAG TPA: glucosidase [Polyangiaceae bacterium]|nr:glucosidase [Polyangiaceae bacterium]
MSKIELRGAERNRLLEARAGTPWRKWGPYLSERQWGTVREDYSCGGDAWGYLSHDQARSRAYRWGEDGLAGFSDDKQRLCFSIALWNGRDPILKERLFGLTNGEGNHGEDVKEYYYYLDSTPTHSYMKWLYKYPHREYPYLDLVETNRRRSRADLEYELVDTGIFDGDCYFDVFVEYAKRGPEDIVMHITIVNRGPEPATLHVLPTLLFRNTWGPGLPRPELRRAECRGAPVIAASHAELGERWLYVDGDFPLYFTDNETNWQRLLGTPNTTPFVKDGIERRVVRMQTEAVNPAEIGTKAAAHQRIVVGAGEKHALRLRLSDVAPADVGRPFEAFDDVIETRRREADEFFTTLTPPDASEDEARVVRQAVAGLLWSKQYYYFDVDRWLTEHGVDTLSGGGSAPRNREWGHMISADVISMPDKWEYPWYAAWDLAFHAIALATVDIDLAKQQLEIVLRETYMHPSAQLPAYEWNFSDVNPPVQPWATIFLYHMESVLYGKRDVEFLKHSFGKLLTNFTWWVNRKDRFGKNVFEGGFLGMDNVGVFDRSAPLPTGGYLEQADGTAWVSLFCQNMLQIASEIATCDPSFEMLAVQFVDHFLLIANALNRVGDGGMWDEEDGFYYDVLRTPDGRATRLKVRSLVGLVPLCATTVFEAWHRERVPQLLAHAADRIRRRPELGDSIHPVGAANRGYADRAILALVNPQRLRRILARMLDEDEFLSSYGIRSLSRVHAHEPYVFWVQGQPYRVDYEPAESSTGMFGGNSNWRGPIWFPMNVLLVRALLQFYSFYGDSFRVECPTGSGRMMNLFEVAREIAWRLIRIFSRNSAGQRPVFGGARLFQDNPHFRDHLLFYEYFHGDNGAGLGASHQTGWTGLAALLVQWFGFVDPQRYLEIGVQPLRAAA